MRWVISHSAPSQNPVLVFNRARLFETSTDEINPRTHIMSKRTEDFSAFCARSYTTVTDVALKFRETIGASHDSGILVTFVLPRCHFKVTGHGTLTDNYGQAGTDLPVDIKTSWYVPACRIKGTLLCRTCYVTPSEERSSGHKHVKVARLLAAAKNNLSCGNVR